MELTRNLLAAELQNFLYNFAHAHGLKIVAGIIVGDVPQAFDNLGDAIGGLVDALHVFQGPREDPGLPVR